MRHKAKIVIANSSEETQRLGEEFARSHLARLQSEAFMQATLIALYGDLGSGKTTFAQGLARGFGIKRRIVSPTFIIVRSYKLESQRSKVKGQKYNSKFKSFKQKNFYHIDLYRIKNERDLEGLGIKEIIDNPENVVVIEWAEKMGKLLPKERWDIRFEHLKNDKRKISIIKNE